MVNSRPERDPESPADAVGGRRRALESPVGLCLWAVWLAFALAAAAPVQAQSSGGDDGGIVTAAVALDGAVLFRVRGASSLPAAVRADAIEGRLRAVAADSAVDADSFRLVDDDGLTRILAGTATLVMAVVDADASLEQVNRRELADVHRLRMRQAVIDYRAARTPQALWRAAGTVLLATLTLAVAIAAVVRGTRYLDRLLTARLRSRIASVGIQSFEVMRAEQIWSALRGVLLGLRTAVLLAVFVSWLTFVLAQLPWSRGLAQDVTSLILRPLEVIGQGLIDNIPSLMFLVVLFLVVRFALRLVRLFFDAIEHGSVVFERFDRDWASPSYKIVRFVLIAFALVVAYPYIPGSDTAAFKGVSLFAGIVFSLGSSTAIANIVAGYMLTYRRAMKVGDRVRIGDAYGDVLETRTQVTHLKSVKNEEIIIPNSQILASEVLNYSSLARTIGLILHTEVGIGYETPWRQVEAMLLAAVDRTEGLSKEPRPYVLLKRLGDFAVTYEVNGCCHDVKRMNEIYTKLHRNILDVFNEYGVQIMTPAYESDPPEPKIVARRQWYAAPAEGPGPDTVPPQQLTPEAADIQAR